MLEREHSSGDFFVCNDILGRVFAQYICLEFELATVTSHGKFRSF